MTGEANQEPKPGQPAPLPEPAARYVPVDVPPVGVSSTVIMTVVNDFVLIFQRPRPVVGADGVGVNHHEALAETVAVLTMSPMTLKDLSVLLQSAVERHEKEYGTIHTPFTKRRLDTPDPS